MICPDMENAGKDTVSSDAVPVALLPADSIATRVFVGK